MSATFRGFVDAEGKFALDYPKAFHTYVARTFKGSEVDVEIRERGSTRTVAQNNGFHAMVTPWAKDGGHDIDYLKRVLLVQIFGTKEVTNPLTGEVELWPNKPHTSDLSVKDFSVLIERTMEIAAGEGQVLMAPDEYRAAHPDKYPVARKRSAA